MIVLLQRETLTLVPPDLWPQNSLDLNSVDNEIWGMMHDGVYQNPVQDVGDLRQRLIDAACKALWTVLLCISSVEKLPLQRHLLSYSLCSKCHVFMYTNEHCQRLTWYHCITQMMSWLTQRSLSTRCIFR